MSDPGSGSGILVRKVRADEVAAFKAFRLRALADAPTAFRTTVAEAQSMPWEHWEHRVRRGALGEESILLVAVDSTAGTWLGITGSYIEDQAPHIAHVVSVWVAPEARRRGVGRALQDAAREWAVARRVREQRLWVTATNDAARLLYASCGFVPTSLVKQHPGYTDLQEMEMSRPLPQSETSEAAPLDSLHSASDPIDE